MLDAIDKNIINAIRKGGLSTQQVWKDSGYAYATVSSRLFKLLQKKVVSMEEKKGRGGINKKYVWFINPKKMWRM